jgi:hypothetical protein
LWQRRIVLLHPPYSPDLAPSDFYLYAALKDAIRENRFGNDDNVLKKRRSGQDNKIQTDIRRGQTFLFPVGARLLKLLEYVEKCGV